MAVERTGGAIRGRARRGAALLAVIGCGALPVRPLAAQADRGVACDGLVVSDIVVSTRGPFLDGGIYDRVKVLARIGDAVHATTREEVVRRFLALRVGEPCSEIRRLETARILRAQPFLADASVTAIPDGVGGVRLEVATVDEFSPVVGLSVTGGATSPTLKGLRLGTLNLAGDAVSIVGEWESGFVYRDLWAIQATDYQVLGRPYQLSLEGARRQLGSDWFAELSHPYFTDLQRIAWRVSAGEASSYAQFMRGDTVSSAALMYARRFLDVGGVMRIGVPGRLSLFGASFSREREIADDLPVIVSDSGLVPDTSTALIGRYGRHRTARVNALWGVRSIQFLRVFGFDALGSTQDVRRGFQLGTLFGRGLSAAGSKDDDIFVSMDLYGGFGTPRAFFGFQIQGEGRQDYDRNRWDGVLGSGRMAWYFKPAIRQTTIASVEFGGGWRQRIPFQLTLGDAEGGIRGYQGSRVGGSQRVVGRVEHRWLFPRAVRHASTGIAFFADAGRMWAGDAPFGVNSPVNSSVGIGLLAAVPVRARRVWRLDIAAPLGPDKRESWTLRVSSSDRTRSFWHEPADVRRGRERSTPTSIFNWP